MLSICGADCASCTQRDTCGGCSRTNGHPFGGECIAANRILRDGPEAFQHWKQELIREINALGISCLHVERLDLLNGFYVNLEYPLPNGQRVKLLEDGKIYLGSQVEIPGNERCYGLIVDEDFLLVCEYGCGGADPEIVLFKRR